MNGFPQELNIHFHWVDTMLAHAASLPQEEICGLVGGTAGNVQWVIPVENWLHRADRYRMEPQALVNALYTLSLRQMTLMAIYHSHPSGPAVPSLRDWTEFAYPGVFTLILSPAPGGDWQMRAFKMDHCGYEEIDCRVIE